MWVKVIGGICKKSKKKNKIFVIYHLSSVIYYLRATMHESNGNSGNIVADTLEKLYFLKFSIYFADNFETSIIISLILSNY